MKIDKGYHLSQLFIEDVNAEFSESIRSLRTLFNHIRMLDAHSYPTAFINYGNLKRSMNSGKVEISVHDLRDYTFDKHRTVDDTAFGGGAGMVMKPEPFFNCVETIFRAFSISLLSRKTSKSLSFLPLGKFTPNLS